MTLASFSRQSLVEEFCVTVLLLFSCSSDINLQTCVWKLDWIKGGHRVNILWVLLYVLRCGLDFDVLYSGYLFFLRNLISSNWLLNYFSSGSVGDTASQCLYRNYVTWKNMYVPHDWNVKITWIYRSNCFFAFPPNNWQRFFSSACLVQCKTQQNELIKY